MRTPTLTPAEMDRIVFPTVELFLEGWGTARISSEIQRRYGVRLTREGVYPVVREAVRREHLLYLPPRERTLGAAIAKFPNNGDIHVVDVERERAAEHVAGVGADLIIELMNEVALENQSSNGEYAVHLGLGVGQTTMRAARRLASHLRADASAPKLIVHSLSTPHSVHDPLETPLASFALFNDAYQKPEFVDLVTEPVVPCEAYEKVLKRRNVDRAFKQAKKIDILLTSMATAKDQHGYLYRYVKDYASDKSRGGVQAKAALDRAGWVGDVQMRPYSEKGPIEIEKGGKPVTLFELPRMVKLASLPNKHVILLCAPCGRCKATKADALMPLLTEPSLHVWNHLILDSGTAQEVVDRRIGG